MLGLGSADTQGRVLFRRLLPLMLALGLCGCAGWMLHPNDRVPAQVAKLAVRASLVVPTLGASELLVCTRGGERLWLDTLWVIDDATQEATRQSFDAPFRSDRERAGLVSSRLIEIREILGGEYLAWHAVAPCRRPTLI